MADAPAARAAASVLSLAGGGPAVRPGLLTGVAPAAATSLERRSTQMRCTLTSFASQTTNTFAPRNDLPANASCR